MTVELKFTHKNGNLTPFKREIQIEKFDTNDEFPTSTLLVKSIVSYDFKGKTKEIILKTLLTDWKQGPL
jgi:hypothetical protein